VLHWFCRAANAARLKKPLVNAMQFLSLRVGDQRVMLQIEHRVNEKPYRFVSGHPILPIEAFQIKWHGVAPQSALAPQVEIGIKVA